MGGLRQIMASVAVMAIAGLALAGGAAQAAKFKVLHSFCEPHHRPCGDGSNPARPAGDGPGRQFLRHDIHGSAQAIRHRVRTGAQDGGGFKFKTLYRFCFAGNLRRKSQWRARHRHAGNLYGTANNLVFELSPGGKKGQWTEKVIYRFCAQQNCTDGENSRRWPDLCGRIEWRAL